jgi:hypothetical protein
LSNSLDDMCNAVYQRYMQTLLPIGDK